MSFVDIYSYSYSYSSTFMYLDVKYYFYILLLKNVNNKSRSEIFLFYKNRFLFIQTLHLSEILFIISLSALASNGFSVEVSLSAAKS